MKTMPIVKFLANEKAMLTFGAQLACACGDTAIVFLYGDLGVGKTTLVRGFLRGLGYPGKVKSPTYTLVEPYEIGNRAIFHFDFYRITDPAELEWIGIQDYFHPGAICLIEWPDCGIGWLPAADLSCYINIKKKGREITIEANSAAGEKIQGMLQHV